MKGKGQWGRTVSETGPEQMLKQNGLWVPEWNAKCRDQYMNVSWLLSSLVEHRREWNKIILKHSSV